MKTQRFFVGIFSIVFFAIYILPLIATSQVTPSRVLKDGERGKNTIIFELQQGDMTIAIPVSHGKWTPKNMSQFIKSGDDGSISTDDIAVGIYYSEGPVKGSTFRQFLPYKFSSDTLWVVIPEMLKIALQKASQEFTGRIPNSARIEIWKDSKIKGNLAAKYPHTDQGWNYSSMINLTAIASGYTEFLGDQFKANEFFASELKKLFSKNNIVSKFPVWGEDAYPPKPF